MDWITNHKTFLTTFYIFNKKESKKTKYKLILSTVTD